MRSSEFFEAMPLGQQASIFGKALARNIGRRLVPGEHYREPESTPTTDQTSATQSAGIPAAKDYSQYDLPTVMRQKKLPSSPATPAQPAAGQGQRTAQSRSRFNVAAPRPPQPPKIKSTVAPVAKLPSTAVPKAPSSKSAISQGIRQSMRAPVARVTAPRPQQQPVLTVGRQKIRPSDPNYQTILRQLQQQGRI